MTPLPLKDGSGWYILLAWPDGREEQMDDFASEEEAQAWIDDESAAWLIDAKKGRWEVPSARPLNFKR
jgi:hypothetical protein